MFESTTSSMSLGLECWPAAIDPLSTSKITNLPVSDVVGLGMSGSGSTCLGRLSYCRRRRNGRPKRITGQSFEPFPYGTDEYGSRIKTCYNRGAPTIVFSETPPLEELGTPLSLSLH